MSQILPIPQREPVERTPRRSATKTRRDAIIARDGPLCAGKGCSALGTELDHVIPLELGAPDELANWQLLCPVHHLAKTALQDIPAIAKARRIRKRLAGERKPRRAIAKHVKPWPKGRKLQSRGFR